MILSFLIGIVFLQLAIYFASFYYRPNTLPSWVITHVFLLLNWLVFPSLFMPKPRPDADFTCGMPVLGVYMAFWMFGTFTILLTWSLWLIIRHSLSREKS